jgi:hypothetical protein
MHVWRIAVAASVVAMAACQLDLQGEALVRGSDSSGPGGPTAPDERSPDAMGPVPASDPGTAQDGGAPGHVVGRGPPDAADEATDAIGIDASHDSGGVDSSAAAVDADSSASSVGADASTPCARLLQCCPNLLVPPLALACMAAAMLDGGDSTCVAALSSLADAGVCP